MTLMGGVRDEGDQGRLDALNTLAKDLGIEVSCKEQFVPSEQKS